MMNYDSVPLADQDGFNKPAPKIIKPQHKMVVKVKWRSFWQKLRRKEETMIFYFDPCLVCNMNRIATAAMHLPKELFGDSIEQLAVDQIETHLPTLVYCIAAGIQNNYKEPAKDLLLFIENNFSHQQLIEGFQYTIDQLGLQSFLNCLVLIQGTANILKPSHPAGAEGTYSVDSSGEIQNDKG